MYSQDHAYGTNSKKVVKTKCNCNRTHAYGQQTESKKKAEAPSYSDGWWVNDVDWVLGLGRAKGGSRLSGF
jgi:hypothetical protein